MSVDSVGQMSERCSRMAERFGLEWIRHPPGPGDPFASVGHFERKDGVRSRDICLVDCCTSDKAKEFIVPEFKRLLGYEAEGSGI